MVICLRINIKMSGPNSALRVDRLPIFAIIAIASATPGLTQGANAPVSEYCFPQKALAIGGVHYRDERKAVDRVLGKPLQTSMISVHGTAGPYRVEQRRYRSVRLNLKASTQAVESIVATGPGVAMPNGIRVGATLEDVSRILRYNVGESLSDDLVWTPSLCEQGPYDWIFVGPQFSFVRQDGKIRLQSIQIKRM